MKIYGICRVVRDSRYDQIRKNNNRCQDNFEQRCSWAQNGVRATNVRYAFYGWLACFLFLAYIPITCEQSIIGKACYLSSWWMKYGTMKGTLLLFANCLGNFLKKKFKINSLSPQWYWISYQGHMLLLLKTFHISCLLCVEFCQVLLTFVERLIMFPRSRYMCYTGSTQKTCLSFPLNKCSMF